jgi:hypothetical protein
MMTFTEFIQAEGKKDNPTTKERGCDHSLPIAMIELQRRTNDNSRHATVRTGSCPAPEYRR